MGYFPPPGIGTLTAGAGIVLSPSPGKPPTVQIAASGSAVSPAWVLGQFDSGGGAIGVGSWINNTGTQTNDGTIYNTVAGDGVTELHIQSAGAGKVYQCVGRFVIQITVAGAGGYLSVGIFSTDGAGVTQQQGGGSLWVPAGVSGLLEFACNAPGFLRPGGMPNVAPRLLANAGGATCFGNAGQLTIAQLTP